MTRFVVDLKMLLEASVETLLKTCVNVAVKAFVEALVKTQMSEYVLEDTGPLHSRACWNDAAGSVGAQRTRLEMADDTSLVKVVASTTDVADVGMNDDRL